MTTSSLKYLGKLRTQCKHLKSGNEMITDAPVDNKGKGEAFSPTDLAATSLASCMITIMGIKAEENNWSLDEIEAEVEKHMRSNPRQIDKILIRFKIQGDLDEREKKLLEAAAKKCPVALSLNPKIQQEVTFNYQ